jgi:hypothetical protein
LPIGVATQYKTPSAIRSIHYPKSPFNLKILPVCSKPSPDGKNDVIVFSLNNLKKRYQDLNTMKRNSHTGAMKYIYSAVLTSLLLLQGCAPTTVQPDVAQGDASVQQANSLLKQGKKREAAQTYYAASARYPSPQRERVILQAAELSASIGDANLTDSYLDHIPASSLDGENQGRYAYVKALLALQSNNSQLALSTLPTNLDDLSPALREKVQNVRQRAQGTIGNGGINVQTAMIPSSTDHIAVLLPQSGALGSVSQDIYQGIQAARSSFGNTSSVQLYDVSAGGAVAQYQRAVAEGADIIVGPLDKDSLAQLLAQPQVLSKPLLSLNYLANNRNIPGALYQFGLLPEDEARQVADFVISRGQRNAIIMAPATAWGDRLANAFRSTYQAKGGQVLNVQQYSDAPSSSYVQNVQNALQAAQGRANMVFLAASPSQARLIRPLLAAQAPDLTVYSTSHIFSGRTDPGKDRDLDGIVYTEIPWVMESLQAGTLNNVKFPRMYALGMDSFLIAKNLPSIARNPATRVAGKTGNINLAGNRQIQRSLTFATFVNGLPQALGQ